MKKYALVMAFFLLSMSCNHNGPEDTTPWDMFWKTEKDSIEEQYGFIKRDILEIYEKQSDSDKLVIDNSLKALSAIISDVSMLDVDNKDDIEKTEKIKSIFVKWETDTIVLTVFSDDKELKDNIERFCRSTKDSLVDMKGYQKKHLK